MKIKDWVKLLFGITFIETFLPYTTGIANWLLTGVVIIGGLIILPITLPIILAWAIVIYLYKRDVKNDEETIQHEEEMTRK